MLKSCQVKRVGRKVLVARVVRHLSQVRSRRALRTWTRGFNVGAPWVFVKRCKFDDASRDRVRRSRRKPLIFTVTLSAGFFDAEALVSPGSG